MSEKENQTRAVVNNASDNSLIANLVPSFHSESGFNMIQRRSPSEFKSSFSISPIEESNAGIQSIRNSTIYTILSSDSSRNNLQSIRREESPIRITSNRRPMSRRSRSPQLSIGSSISNKEYCYSCDSIQNTGTKIQNQELDLWKSILYFFDYMKCCGEPNILMRYEETVIYCLKCHCELSKFSNK